MAFIFLIKNKPFLVGLISRAKCLAMIYSLIKVAKASFFGWINQIDYWKHLPKTNKQNNNIKQKLIEVVEAKYS